MNFITKLSLVLNLTLGSFAWWQYHSAHAEAESWLKKQLSKAEAQAAASCDEIRNCSSLWKIAYDIKATPLPSMEIGADTTDLFSSSSQIAIAPHGESVNSSTETHENTQDTPETDSHSETKSLPTMEHNSIAGNEHESKNPGEHTTPLDLPKWASDIQRRIENEKIWGAEIEVDSAASSANMLVLSGGGCKMGIHYEENKYRVDIGSMRK